MSDAYLQVAPDGSGKKVANFAVTLPIGTAVTDGSGTVSYLAAATTVFLQRVVLSDSDGNEIDPTGNDRQGELIAEIRELRRVFCEANDQLFIDQPEEN